MMIEQKYIIHQSQSLLEALTQINALLQGPLVLFVVDDEDRMVGTLTDGDARRALIAGANVSEKTQAVMHTNFNFIREGEGDIVVQLHSIFLVSKPSGQNYFFLFHILDILYLSNGSPPVAKIHHVQDR